MEAEKMKKQIGNNILYCRKQKRVKQQDLADSIGKSPSYICDMEKGRTMPSLKVLLEIAESLNIDIAEFFKNT